MLSIFFEIFPFNPLTEVLNAIISPFLSISKKASAATLSFRNSGKLSPIKEALPLSPTVKSLEMLIELNSYCIPQKVIRALKSQVIFEKSNSHVFRLNAAFATEILFIRYSGGNSIHELSNEIKGSLSVKITCTLSAESFQFPKISNDE